MRYIYTTRGEQKGTVIRRFREKAFCCEVAVVVFFSFYTSGRYLRQSFYVRVLHEKLPSDMYIVHNDPRQRRLTDRKQQIDVSAEPYGLMDKLNFSLRRKIPHQVEVFLDVSRAHLPNHR